MEHLGGSVTGARAPARIPLASITLRGPPPASPVAPLPGGDLRAPPEFREELHPEEIVRRPSRHPWFTTIAVLFLALVTGMVLRALAAPSGPDADAAHHPSALEHATHAPHPSGGRSAGMRTGR